MNIAIIVGEFHKEIAEVMLASAKDEAAKLGVTVAREVWVPGSYEVPLATYLAFCDYGIDGIVVLGYIEKGETMHGAVMGHVVESALVQMGIDNVKPVGHGIIGPGATREQAEARKVGVARRAVQAVHKMYELKQQEF